jgi:hypothetical protein
MYEMARTKERERRKVIFPARLHVRNKTENVVGLDLAAKGCRIKSKSNINILSKLILEFYIPSAKEDGKYTLGDPIGDVLVRWTKPSHKKGYFIHGLEFGSVPRDNHGINYFLGKEHSGFAEKLTCENSSLKGHYVECFACSHQSIEQYSLKKESVHTQNNIFGIPTYGEPFPGLDPIDYNLLYLTICPNCNFTAPGDEFFKYSEEDEPSFRIETFSDKWAEGRAELSEKYETLKEGINGEERSVEQSLLGYELATGTFRTLCDVDPKNGAFVGLLAMIRARQAQLCITNLVEPSDNGKEKAQELLMEAQKDLDENFEKLNEIQSLLAAQLLVAISVYFKDIDITGKYMKYLDRFDAMEKPAEGSQTAKTLSKARITVEELYKNRHEYHKDQLKTFLPQKIS